MRATTKEQQGMTTLTKARRISIRGDADVSKAVLLASQLGSAVGLEPRQVNRAATAVAELARNIVKYAGSGEIYLQPVMDAPARPLGLDVLANDKGPGIEDVEQALEDNFSSSGTLGLGLPGVRRLADEFEIETQPGRGTRVRVRILVEAKRELRQPRPRHPSGATEAGLKPSRPIMGFRGRGGIAPPMPGDVVRSPSCAYFVRPCLGERISGDGVHLSWHHSTLLAAIVDGLGHGARAYEATRVALEILAASEGPEVLPRLRSLHEKLRGTVGAAIGVCAVDVSRLSVSYAAVGNTVLRIIGDEDRRVPAEAGTIGERMRTPAEHRLRLKPNDTLLMYSDGISDRFSSNDYPQMRYEAVDKVARRIVERFGKDHDDASCIALRLDT
jgi:anti-sigma regulatory factor (Ser/Thr protein kinase)